MTSEKTKGPEPVAWLVPNTEYPTPGEQKYLVIADGTHPHVRELTGAFPVFASPAALENEAAAREPLTDEQIDAAEKAYAARAIPAWTSNLHRPGLIAALRAALATQPGVPEPAPRPIVNVDWEPAGEVYTMQACEPHAPEVCHVSLYRPLPRGTKLYALRHETESDSESPKPAQGNLTERDGKSAEPAGRRVVCAAIRASDGRLVLGIRHYSQDMHYQLARRDDRLRFQNLLDPDQGFVDQFGAYLTREEAYQVALAAGQIVRPEACGEGLDGPKLYSEGLY